MYVLVGVGRCNSESMCVPAYIGCLQRPPANSVAPSVKGCSSLRIDHLIGQARGLFCPVIVQL